MKLKNLFPGYYPPEDADLKHWWQTGLIVFEANALLDLYGLEASTRAELLKFLESVKERLWIPHQVAWEFHRNRVRVIRQQVNKYKEAISRLQPLVPNLQSQIGEARKALETASYDAVKAVARQTANQFDELLSETNTVTEHLQANVAKLLSALETARDAQEALVVNDPILEAVSALFGDNVGAPFTEEVLAGIYRDGEKRYAAVPQIPPGYKDADNKDKPGNRKYGDLVLWRQTIAKAKDAQLPVLMVNSEQKADWVEEFGDGKRPRSELVQEMYAEAGAPFLMFSLRDFMQLSGKYLGVKFSSEAISDVMRVEDSVKVSDALVMREIQLLDGDTDAFASIASQSLSDAAHHYRLGTSDTSPQLMMYHLHQAAQYLIDALAARDLIVLQSSADRWLYLKEHHGVPVANTYTSLRAYAVIRIGVSEQALNDAYQTFKQFLSAVRLAGIDWDELSNRFLMQWTR